MYHNILMEKTQNRVSLYTQQAYSQRSLAKPSLTDPLPGGLIRKVITNLSIQMDVAAWEIMPKGEHEDIEAVRAVIPLQGKLFQRITRGAMEATITKVHHSLFEGGAIPLTDEEVDQIRQSLPEGQIFSADDYNYEMLPVYTLFATQDFNELIRVMKKVRPTTEDDFFNAMSMLADALVLVEDYAVMEIQSSDPQVLDIAINGVINQVEVLPPPAE